MSNGNVRKQVSLFPPTSHDRIARTVCDFATSLGLPEPVHIGRGIFAVTATIAPETAMEILTSHHIDNNRHRKVSAIASYSMDMACDEWALTHQGIAFNEALDLYDGQNRLYACVDSEKPFTTIVFFNVPNRAMTDTDTGVKRSILDASKIRGTTENSQWATVVRHIACGPNVSRLSNNVTFQLGEILDESVRWVQSQFPSHVSRITVGSVLGAIGRAFYHVDLDRLAELCTVLREGVYRAESDKAAHTLLKYLNQHSGYGHGMAIDRFSKTQAGIYAFDKRQPIAKLYGFAEDKFPLPTEIAAAVAKVLGE